MSPDNDLTRIANYLAGEGAAHERAETERWIAEDPKRRAVVDSLRAPWIRAGRPEPQLDVDRAWEQLQRRQAARDVPEAAQPHAQISHRHVLQLMPRSPWSRGTLWTRAAAVIAVVSAGALATQLALRSPSAQPVAPAMRDVATARGQRAMLTLGDGSRVSLGVQSRLRFAEGFGGARRDVYLEGEALFEVRHDSLRPFVVHTARATTTDLGTTFVVRDYAVDNSVSVAVREGKVGLRSTRVSLDSSTLNLAAGEFARLNAAGEISNRRGTADDYFAWTEGRLVFRNTPLTEVAATLERWYDVDILIGPAGRQRTVNAAFGDDGIETVLNLIAKATDMRVSSRGKTFTLSPHA